MQCPYGRADGGSRQQYGRESDASQGVGVSILPFALRLHLATSCAPSLAPETLLSVVPTEPGFDSFAVSANTAARAYHPAALIVLAALGYYVGWANGHAP